MTTRKRPTPVSVRRSLVDPVVIVAIFGLLGGAISLAVTTEDAKSRLMAQLAASREQAICDRAFAFLQDEAISPKLLADVAFYQSQRRIAERCSAEGNKR